MTPALPPNWRKGVAYVLVASYAYQLVLWPLLFWLCNLATLWTGQQWPAPTLLPWEHLMSGTATLAAIAGIDIARDKLVPTEEAPKSTVQRL